MEDDQFACGMGESGHAYGLPVAHYENVPVALGDYRILIVNTGVKRALASSAYNERRAQCDEAVRRLVNEGIQAQSPGYFTDCWRQINNDCLI